MISLGSSCSVSYNIRKYNLRKYNYQIQSYPFDWLRCDRLSDITNAIEDDFRLFLSTEEIGRSDKFPVHDNSNKDNSNKDNESIIMKNGYNMKFYHDFNENSDITTIREKYNRRIRRFMNMIKTEKKITFVRDELHINQIDMEQIQSFIRVIMDLNHKLEFNLIIILHNPKNKEHHLYNTDIIKIIEDREPYGDWTRPNLRWDDIFGLNK